eukprot:10078600-Alexandrium_andersonii.AAC.1
MFCGILEFDSESGDQRKGFAIPFPGLKFQPSRYTNAQKFPGHLRTEDKDELFFKFLEMGENKSKARRIMAHG